MACRNCGTPTLLFDGLSCLEADSKQVLTLGACHVRTRQPFPWLDHHKHPWISLTNAAIYLSRRDASGRSRAVYCPRDGWRHSAFYLNGSDAGRIAVYRKLGDGTSNKSKSREFLNTPINFPSYSLADRLEIISRFLPGENTYIECNHNLFEVYAGTRSLLCPRSIGAPLA